ncbi:GTP-binding protein LepA [Candidatus Termititenax dinenymphae]|uniref:Large ribosomal subunit assembly factor BipA n=1 Tax=Candidatus Termititenax dinenymphae TaxID=2218523 RepID=A0A388TKV2_9BACT|nr:GTP-binding protein LepA [Candidatus Termititenax dinenymphae]
MEQSKIRNIAIIAHVDHGKTTLVDQLFRQSGMFRDNQAVAERMMDSMDLERERGITIAAKNGSFKYKDYLINIIDTPGHADFGGQVERVLKMADGVLLLVDASEGPMPQTYFVLKKALSLNLPAIVVINKIDKPLARPSWVVDQVFDLFVRLNAPEHILDFPIVYASAKNGISTLNVDQPGTDMQSLLDTIVDKIPPPAGTADAPVQILISSLDYSSFLGRLGIGKITSGKLKINQDVVVMRGEEKLYQTRITKIYRFEGNEKKETESASTGEVVAVAGMEDIMVGQTITDPLEPRPLPVIVIDPPTLSMNFIPNDSPFSGKEGQFVTSRHLRDRLFKETLSDIAILVEELTDAVGYKVSGRGELHLSVLVEKMRREGYEFQITRPKVIFKEENGITLEPYEELIIDVDEQYMGAVIENLGQRKGVMSAMDHNDGGMVRLTYKIPTRGLLGFRSEFMTATKGMGVMNYVFLEYGQYAGDMRNRSNGVLISMDQCQTLAYDLFTLQDRGRLFMSSGEQVYVGQIIGEHSRENDLNVNPGRGKKLTNVRNKAAEEKRILTPHIVMSLEDCIDFINDDELVEVTPKAIRLRKMPWAIRKN